MARKTLPPNRSPRPDKQTVPGLSPGNPGAAVIPYPGLGRNPVVQKLPVTPMVQDNPPVNPVTGTPNSGVVPVPGLSGATTGYNKDLVDAASKRFGRQMGAPGDTITDPNSPNMLGIFDKNGVLHWVSRGDRDTQDLLLKDTGPSLGVPAPSQPVGPLPTPEATSSQEQADQYRQQDKQKNGPQATTGKQRGLSSPYPDTGTGAKTNTPTEGGTSGGPTPGSTPPTPEEDDNGDSGYRNSAGTVVTNRELRAMKKSGQLEDFIRRGLILEPGAAKRPLGVDDPDLLDILNRYQAAGGKGDIESLIAAYAASHGIEGGTPGKRSPEFQELRKKVQMALNSGQDLGAAAKAIRDANTRGDAAKQMAAALLPIINKLYGGEKQLALIGTTPAAALANLTPVILQSFYDAKDHSGLSEQDYLSLKNYLVNTRKMSWPKSASGTPSGDLDTKVDQATGGKTATYGSASVTPEETASWVAGFNAHKKTPVPDAGDRAGLELWLSNGPPPPPPGFVQGPNGWVDTDPSSKTGIPSGERLAMLNSYLDYIHTGFADKHSIAQKRMGFILDGEANASAIANEKAQLDKEKADNNYLGALEHAENLRKLEEEQRRLDNKKKVFDVLSQVLQHPSVLMSYSASGQLDQFNKDFGLDLKVPARKSQQDVMALLPSLGDLGHMPYNQVVEAATNLFWSTGWSPEELIALVLQIRAGGGSPYGNAAGPYAIRHGNAEESTAKRQ